MLRCKFDGMTERFEDVVAWQRAYDFTLKVYKATALFPAEERFGLKSQFQRAAVSIPANIAEGYRRIGRADKLHFFNIAQGSLEECRCYIHLSKDVGYLSVETCQLLYSSLEEASKMLNWYCKGIRDNAYKKGVADTSDAVIPL